MLFAVFQRYILRAIHNDVPLTLPFYWLFAVFQRYILRAIHNRQHTHYKHHLVVCGISKIHFESNSQLSAYCDLIFCCCLRYFKDTF